MFPMEASISAGDICWILEFLYLKHLDFELTTSDPYLVQSLLIFMIQRREGRLLFLDMFFFCS